MNPLSKQALMFMIVNQRSQAIKMAQRLTQFIFMFISTTTNSYNSKSTMERIYVEFFFLKIFVLPNHSFYQIKVVVLIFLNVHWFSIHNSLQYKMVLVLKNM
jgi:hypothetical protein